MNAVYQTFKASNGMSGQYHIWDEGLDSSKPIGLMLELHGDGAYSFLHPDSSYNLAGSNGLRAVAKKHNMVLVSCKTPDVINEKITWWRTGSANADYMRDLLQKFKDEYKPSSIWLNGFSGGAQFITQFFVPRYSSMLGKGGALIFGGGGVPRVTVNTFSEDLKRDFRMYWISGAQDDGTIYKPYAGLTDGKRGLAWYKERNFKTSLTEIPNRTHDLPGLFGPETNKVLEAQVESMPQTCERYGTFVTKANKAISNNRWGADTAQCIETVGDSGFKVTRAEHNKNGVASYPSFYEGMWPSTSNITKNSKFPIKVGDFVKKPPLISKFTYTKPTTSSHYNVAFDIWFGRERSTAHKLELMIWNMHTGMAPIGKKIGEWHTYDVWSGYLGSTHVVSYVAKKVIPSGTVALNVTAFVIDLVKRGYLVASDWLTSVQNGFELWRGGAGLQMTDYSLEYVEETGEVVPTDAENIKAAQVTLNGGSEGYPDSFHNRLERIASKLRDGMTEKPTLPTNSGGPYWTVEKGSDDVNQQLNSRYAALGTNLSSDELLEHVEQLLGTDKVIVTNPTPPSTPQNMTAVVDTATRQIVLNWDDFPNATGYKIYETATPNGVGTVTASESKRGPFNEYRTYDYWVTAIVDGVETGPSVKASVVYAAPATPTPDPTTESIYADSPAWASSWSNGDVLDGGKFKSAPWNWQSSTPTVVDAPTPYPDNELRIQFGANGAQYPASGASPGSGSRRCEVEPNRGISSGRTEYMRFDIRLVNFPRSTGSWNVFYQAKGDGTGSPPMELSVEAGRWKVIYHNSSGGVVRKDDLGVVSSDPNKADIIILEIGWGSNGTIQGWVNDELRLSRRSAPTMHPNKGSYHKMGLYASSAISQAVDVRFEHVAIGASYDAVR